MFAAMFERKPEYFRHFQKIFDILFVIVSHNLILILQ